jgi:two-component system response regulator YesN
MIRTIIADDDVETLEGLRRVIPWGRHGFRVVATATDGRKALELVKRHRPDLLIADITMPAMDGLTLIRAAKELHPHLKSVVLTCHEEFALARESIQLGVMDYLLKIALTPESLVECLRRIRRVIDGENDADTTIVNLKREANHSRLHLQADFFLSIIEAGRAGGSEVLARARSLGIGFPGVFYRALVFYLDDVADPPRRLAAEVLEILSQVFAGDRMSAVFARGERETVVLRWHREEPREIDTRLRAAAARALAQIRERTGLEASCCVSAPSRDITDLADVVATCAAMRDGYFYRGTGSIHASPPQPWDGGKTPPYAPLAEMLVRALQAPAKASEEALVRDLEQRLNAARPAPAAVRELARRLRVEIDAAANRRGFVLDCTPGPGDTLRGCLAHLAGELGEFRRRASEAIRVSGRPEINRVLEYIHEHLDQSIRCEGMAELVGLNGSYFSRLFKKETGESFTDYLMRQRIARSHELLNRTTMSFEEITWAVGLENVSYFHRMFKTYTGLTPRQARQRPDTARPGMS